MRVAIFTETYYPFISGVVTHIHTLKQGLERSGHEVLIVTLDPHARHHYVRDNILYCPAIPLKKIYGYGVANPVNLQRLRVIHRFNPDVIHIHTEFSMGIFGLFAGRQLKKPVVYTLHTMYDDYVFYLFPEKMPERMKGMAKPMAHRYIRKVAQQAQQVIGPSYKVVEYLHHCGVERHINIVPNTVDTTAFLPENENKAAVQALREKLHMKEEDVALCFVGRLGKEKSIDVLLDCFAAGFKGIEKYRLFIAGDGPERQALSAQIKRLGLAKQVQLLGRVDHGEVPNLYRACQLFVTASLTEMNSISFLEATASGLYTIQRFDVYNRDQIVSGVNGEVFDTSEEFAAIVREYGALTLEGREKKRTDVANFAKRYGVDEFTRAVLNVYERAVYGYNGQ